jgi:membrane-associated phospholipid phosphatase
LKPVDRKFLVGVAIIATILLVLGFFVVDRPLAEWVRTSGAENVAAIVWLQDAIERITGFHWSRWIFGAVALVVGIVAIATRRAQRFGAILVFAALVQYATNVVMLIGKDSFGRLRPYQVLASGDWPHAWFGDGVSFPSGHLAFFAGFFIPLAACVQNLWLRALIVCVPLFFAIARIDVAAHFVSDVSASTLISALMSLIAAAIASRLRVRALGY